MTDFSDDFVLRCTRVALDGYRLKLLAPNVMPGGADEYRESALAWVRELLPRLESPSDR